MTKFATFDVDGRISARYDSTINRTIPEGAVELSDDLFFETISTPEGYWELVNGVVTHVPPPALTPEETFQALVKQFDRAIEAHLHAEAVAHGYTNIERACMYAPVPNPYEAESKSFVEWVGNVWAYCYAELLKIQAGTRSIPDLETFLLELPTRVIPQ